MEVLNNPMTNYYRKKIYKGRIFLEMEKRKKCIWERRRGYTQHCPGKMIGILYKSNIHTKNEAV